MPIAPTNYDMSKMSAKKHGVFQREQKIVENKFKLEKEAVQKKANDEIQDLEKQRENAISELSKNVISGKIEK